MLSHTLYHGRMIRVCPTSSRVTSPVGVLWTPNRDPHGNGQAFRITAARADWLIDLDLEADPPRHELREAVVVPDYGVKLTPAGGRAVAFYIRYAPTPDHAPRGGGSSHFGIDAPFDHLRIEPAFTSELRALHRRGLKTE